jgi:hypothetical protein
MLLILGLAGLYCGSQREAEEGGKDLLYALEKALIESQSVLITFDISGTGSVIAEFKGVLIVQPENRLVWRARGSFSGTPMDLELVSDGEFMIGKTPETTFKKRTPKHLNQAVLIGATRMGLMHNLARLSGGAAPDYTDGRIHEWVQVSDVLLDRADPTDDIFATLQFNVLVNSEHVAETELVLAKQTRLPQKRIQTVHFTQGDMTAIERYTTFEPNPAVDPENFNLDRLRSD